MKPSDLEGTWYNQNESELRIKSVDGKTGVLSGEFDSGVGDDGKTLWIPIRGQVLLSKDGKLLEDVLTMFASYPMFGTVVSWVGQHTLNSDGEYEVRTMWVHASNVEEAQELAWMWYSNRVGSDVFTRKKQ